MNKKMDKFLKRLDDLYRLIESFCQKEKLAFHYRDIDICEELAGKYRAREMLVNRGNEFLFKVKPVGAYIIAADGRADIIGRLDERVLIFLEKPYGFELKEIVENQEISSFRPLYEGFEGEGWYISMEKKKVVPLNENTLRWLVEEISGSGHAGEDSRALQNL